MKHSYLEEIEKLAEKALEISSQENRAEALAKAFELFVKEANKLQNSYEHLKKTLSNIYMELEQTNQSLQEKIKQLHITSSYLNNILSNMRQGLIFVNSSGIITTYNPAAERILHKEAIDVLYQPFSQVFEDDLFGFSIKALLFSQKDTKQTIIRLERREKEEFEMEVEVETKFVLKKANHVQTASRDETLDFAQGLIILLRNVTEIQKLRRIIERKNRMQELGEMASFIAHEIRNPLGGIKGFADLLKRDLQEFPDRQQMVQYILDGAESLNQIVNNILDYARPITPHTILVDLKTLLNEIISGTKFDKENFEHITFSFEGEQESIPCKIDIQLTKAAILNLILNASQSMNKKGTILFKLCKENRYGICHIVDEGCGIAKENMEKIFSPFFTTKSSGNGFGLPLAYKVFALQGGNLLASSQIGVGSIFSVYLPLGGLQD